MRLNGIKTHEPQRLFSLRFAFYSLASVSSPTVGSASGSLSGSVGVGAVVVGAGAAPFGKTNSTSELPATVRPLSEPVSLFEQIG